MSAYRWYRKSDGAQKSKIPMPQLNHGILNAHSHEDAISNKVPCDLLRPNDKKLSHRHRANRSTKQVVIGLTQIVGNCRGYACWLQRWVRLPGSHATERTTSITASSAAVLPKSNSRTTLSGDDIPTCRSALKNIVRRSS